MLRGRWFLPMIRSIQNHPVYYAGWLFVFIASMFCGIKTMRLLSDVNGYSFEHTMRSWIASYGQHEKSVGQLLLNSLFVHGRWLLLILIAGYIRFGSALLFVVPAVRGFGIGATMGMSLSCFGFGGLLFAIAIVLMQNVLLIPCYLHAGTYSMARIHTNHRIRAYRTYLLPSFIFFAVAIIMDCSILPWTIGFLGAAYI